MEQAAPQLTRVTLTGIFTAFGIAGTDHSVRYVQVHQPFVALVRIQYRHVHLIDCRFVCRARYEHAKKWSRE